MKFTIWERNLIHDLCGQQKMAEVKSLELLLELRKKFNIPEDDEPTWRRYTRLCVLDDRSEKQQEFFDKYHEEVQSETVEIDLTKKEFEFIYGKVNGNSALPSTEELIEHSIAFKHKLKDKKNEEDKI